MAYDPIVKNVQLVFGLSLISRATGQLQLNPTIAAGDFKVSKDFGALTDLTTLPTVEPAAGAIIKVTLSATEMNADNVAVVAIDQAGAEWSDCQIVFLPTLYNVGEMISTPLAATLPALTVNPSALEALNMLAAFHTNRFNDATTDIATIYAADGVTPLYTLTITLDTDGNPIGTVRLT